MNYGCGTGMIGPNKASDEGKKTAMILSGLDHHQYW